MSTRLVSLSLFSRPAGPIAVSFSAAARSGFLALLASCFVSHTTPPPTRPVGARKSFRALNRLRLARCFVNGLHLPLEDKIMQSAAALPYVTLAAPCRLAVLSTVRVVPLIKKVIILEERGARARAWPVYSSQCLPTARMGYARKGKNGTLPSSFAEELWYHIRKGMVDSYTGRR